MKKIAILFTVFLLLSPVVTFAELMNLQEKVAGDVIAVTEWNSLRAALILAASDINPAHQTDRFVISATAAGNFASGTTIPFWQPPRDKNCEITQIKAGVIGGGTLAFGIEERDEDNMDKAASAIIQTASNLAIDGNMTTFQPIVDFRDFYVNTDSVLCATFGPNCATGNAIFLFIEIEYRKMFDGDE